MEQATQALQTLRRHLSGHDVIRPLPFTEPEEITAQYIARMLRRSRTGRGWSQRYAAEQLGVSRAQYLRYEAGTSIPRLHTACLWSLKFGVPPATLLAQSAYHPGDSLRLPQHFYRLSHWLCRAPASVFVETLEHLQRLLGGREVLLNPASLALPQPLLDAALQEVSGHDLYAVIGANLRLTRQLLGYSQEALANGLGISPSHYLRIEQGDTTYSFLLLPRFTLCMRLPPLVLAANTHYHAGRGALDRRLHCVLEVISPLSEPVSEMAIDYITQAMTLYAARLGSQRSADHHLP